MADPNYGGQGNGYADQGYADQGYPDQGYADQGQGYPDQGQGYVDQGYDDQGQGYPDQGQGYADQNYGGDPNYAGQDYGGGVQYDPQADGGDPYYGGQPPYEEGFSEGIPDILYLNHFCANAFPPQDVSEEAKMQADASWEPVRDWLRTHSAQEVLEAAEQRDDAGKTALHFACQNAPPKDVIDVFLSIAANTVQWPDTSGWLPIHYACAYGADTEVIKNLADAFPESKTTVDRKGRTPLHFALGSSSSNSYDVIVMLTSSGASGFKDDNGMLPLHYACAYGASEESFLVLTNSYPEAISTLDRWGRTPLHFALSNAGRKNAPAAVRLLLSLDKDVVNSVGGGRLPLRVLSEFSVTLTKAGDDEQREAVQACLALLLDANPDPTADFFTAMQSLPGWLQESAVVMRSVQVLLNVKIAQRFPTLILMLDFYVQMVVVVAYSITVQDSVDLRFADPPNDPPALDATIWLILLFLGATYFLMREAIQILSLLSLGAIRVWIYEPSNWLSVFYIGLMYFWAMQMYLGTMEADSFRTWAAVSLSIIWIKFMAYLRNILIAFAVFTGGVFNVILRLAAFFICLVIILIAFSRMLFTIFQQSPYCTTELNELPQEGSPEYNEDIQCDELEVHAWCTNWDAWLSIYTMLLGEVDETKFEEDKFAMVLFALFMFLVVILLANVLIAIVTDSYKVIQDQRAAIVFWTNRLDFIAQMDAIANGPWKTRVRRTFGLTDDVNFAVGSIFGVNFGKDMWRRIMDLFEDDLDESLFSFEFICQTGLRIVTAIFVVPAWIILGIVTAGWFWPPQIREYVFTSTIAKHSSDIEKDEALRKHQLDKVRAEIGVLRDELQQELAVDRTNLVQLKSVVAEKKTEIQNEMKHIKRVVAMLFEQQGGGT